MALSDDDIIVEEAKDSNYTCRVCHEGAWFYLYSKYKPKARVTYEDIDAAKDGVVLFGLGLGLELQSLVEAGKHVVVVERHRLFYDFVCQQQQYKDLLDSGLVTILVGNEYKDYILPFETMTFLYNAIFPYEKEYYRGVMKTFLRERKKQQHDDKKIVLFSHITIAEDCAQSFEKQGYDVVRVDVETMKTEFDVYTVIQKERPDFLFGINIISVVLEASSHIGVPYICWIVDTPCFRVYSKDVVRDNIFLFSYDPSMVEDLRGKGVANISYMPVAAPVHRFDEVTIHDEDRKKYSADISFVGTTGMGSEYNEHEIEKLLSPEMKKYIEDIFEMQRMTPRSFILPQLIDDAFVMRMKAETGCCFLSSPLILCTERERITYIMSKKYNERERIHVAQNLSQRYQCKVYGDESWKGLIEENVYEGYADHYDLMPKVFKLTDINVNIIRVYVDAGLPMRVFDVLGCGGFLVTNFREDIARLFSPGRDLVVYRDMQDLVDICAHYLKNPIERMEIAAQGYATVCREHTYDHRIKAIMEAVEAMPNGKG
jgi:spore maturation protein CgeB